MIDRHGVLERKTKKLKRRSDFESPLITTDTRDGTTRPKRTPIDTSCEDLIYF